MIDHLSLGARSLDRARRFYDALLAPLGHALLRASESELAYGPGGEIGLFYLYPVAKGRVAGLGLHVAFGAGTRAAVDEAYAAAMREGGVSVRPAGPRPDLSPDYYGAVLFDPDGNKLEIVLAANGD
jgi:catechol 2,3-dioxygenase-like lactoylglutathione lyase family enzyme